MSGGRDDAEMARTMVVRRIDAKGEVGELNKQLAALIELRRCYERNRDGALNVLRSETRNGVVYQCSLQCYNM